MAEKRESDQDKLGDRFLSEWEEQCAVEHELNMDKMDERSQYESERSAQKLWLSFQNSATSIAKLYKDRSGPTGVSLWVPFQNSASCVTHMYKDSLDATRKHHEHGVQVGQNRRTKELLNWARKRRRHIRREDLIAFLCGKSVPVRPRPTSALGRVVTGADFNSSLVMAPPRLPPPEDIPDDSGGEPDLQPFRDALALQRLNGAMSNIGFNAPDRHADSSVERTQCSDDDDFHCFILDEISRRCGTSRKRTSGTSDHTLADSPSRKRSRLL